MSDTSSLVQVLRSQQLRIRTGIILLPFEWVGRESDIAVYLGLCHYNICEWVIAQLPPDRRWLGLESRHIFDLLDSILNNEATYGRCVLISDIDVLLAGISSADRMHFWDFFRMTFRRDRGVILTIPDGAKVLLPANEIEKWGTVERIANWRGLADEP